ncbi:gliding motility protein GldM [Oceanihabitans sediminis]|uniref:Gliding motility protein GldM n=1 Tax=Oceanihabitans sediminis TaxID=1812012 RepID=A0A368P526_9FLAO|nr:gliding motility protein GldM [Oceanihabitans sediminis]MDX1279034.1 gliding motility protein GldM [Oceanihabitans sediminis]MDX1772575.1 gliding motility protein GldM [Oceanihabitans sediminis]RBP34242.1 protein involved in gliding motility GldM [Oceanihabitans sediminis]RCU57932.1 gliding motility protein GldM [Oceanihabitans sediminis]
MAGGKASARQKMINLMYLVFIAMMAMNMSKEVLSAFGLMEAKFAESNEATTERNEKLLAELDVKAEENPQQFKVPAARAKQVKIASDKFFNYLESLKADLIKAGKYQESIKEGDFEAMDKTDILDAAWFTGDRLTKKGQEVMDNINEYKKAINEILATDESYRGRAEAFEKTFSTNPVEDKEGKKIDWLSYHYQGFPAIASYTKLTAMQNDVKVTESDIFSLFLGNIVSEATTLNNYKAIVLPEKSAFFAGEQFKGRVVIGKYANVPPTKLTVQGKEVDLSKAIDSSGAATLDFNVGNVGEHELKGEFTFIENNEELKIPISANYVVVPRPNSATISADKMNVVYRGVNNPMTISFAGVPDSKVNATGAGLRKGSGAGKYNMVPTTGSEVTINVTAKLEDGSTVGDKKSFRIKDIPKPSGQMVGKTGQFSLPRNNVEIGKVEAVLEDFDFDLPLTVTSFKFKVPGSPSVTCQGNRLNSQAKAALRKAKRGADVTIFDIKSKSNGPRIKPAAPIIIELSN